MSYRKINVNGKTYEFKVGSKHFNIRGIGTFLNSDYGEEFDGRCECCGEGGHLEFLITPKHIRKVILERI